jgi:hypothetical protein
MNEYVQQFQAPRLLKNASGIAAAAAAALMPPNVQRVLAQPQPRRISRTFGGLTSAFRFGEPGQKPPVLPDSSGPLTLAKFSAANLPQPVLPAGDQQPLKQEKGRRSHVSINQG